MGVKIKVQPQGSLKNRFLYASFHCTECPKKLCLDCVAVVEEPQILSFRFDCLGQASN